MVFHVARKNTSREKNEPLDRNVTPPPEGAMRHDTASGLEFGLCRFVFVIAGPSPRATLGWGCQVRQSMLT
jgi:hypothetical protein